MGHTFVANLNADKMYIERGNLADPVAYVFQVLLQNQSSTQAIYFQATTTLSGWTITAPALGKLGAIGAGGAANVSITMSRARPGSDTTDTGNIRIEGFSDSDYTISLGYDDLACTVYFEETEVWLDKTIYDFAIGDFQGWGTTGWAALEVVNDKAIDVGGYSLRGSNIYTYGTWSISPIISRSIVLPNKTKVRITFYFCYRLYTAGGAHTCWWSNPRILADSTTVTTMSSLTIDSIGSYQTLEKGWFKMTADLSAYKGLTKTIKFQIDCGGSGAGYGIFNLWLDRIVIAGTD